MEVEEKLHAAWLCLSHSRPGSFREMLTSSVFDWAVREYHGHPHTVWSANVFENARQHAAGQPVRDHVRWGTFSELAGRHSGKLPEGTLIPLSSDGVHGAGDLFGPAHWSVLLFSDGTLWHADSLGGAHTRYAATVCRLLGERGYVPPHRVVRRVPCPQQTDAWSCGWHALLNASLLLAGGQRRALAYEPFDLQQHLTRLLAACQTQKGMAEYRARLRRRWFRDLPRAGDN